MARSTAYITTSHAALAAAASTPPENFSVPAGCGRAGATAAIPHRDLYPLREARQLLGGIAHSTAYEMIGEGRLRVVHIGRRVFVPRAEIARIVAGGEAGRE